MAEGFWARKVAEKRLAANHGVIPPDAPARPSGQPWWAQGSRLVPATQIAGQGVLDLPGIVEGHDVSKARHLSNSGNCPDCGSGNYMTMTGSKMSRCFDCGWNTAKEGMHPTAGLSAVTEGGSTPARQVSSAGGVTHNFHGNIKSASEAVGRVG